MQQASDGKIVALLEIANLGREQDLTDSAEPLSMNVPGGVLITPLFHMIQSTCCCKEAVIFRDQRARSAAGFVRLFEDLSTTDLCRMTRI